MIAPIVFVLLSMAGDAGCRGGEWEGRIAQTETLIERQEPLRVPRDPLGSKYDSSCVRIEFELSDQGIPRRVEISRSSGNRSIDVAAREAVKRYRFSPSKYNRRKFALAFDYPETISP